MTLNDLLVVYFKASNHASVTTALDKPDFASITMKAGIRAVVLALRDHLRKEAPNWSHGWGIIEVENEINDILGGAGEEATKP